MNTTSTGGFIGDPAEAFTPPAATGCCGGPTAVVDASTAAPAASTCCGTAEAADAAGSCCEPAAKTDAVAAGAGCCG
jgi:hypothetical protein